MHKIDSNGHNNNRFVDEDVNNAIQGTTLSADWLNSIQEELINILIVAGTDPSKTDNTQLARAFELLGGSKKWDDIIGKPKLVTQTQLTTALSSLNQLVLSIVDNTVAGVDFATISNIAVNSTDDVGVVLVRSTHSGDFDQHTTNAIILKPTTADKDYVITNTRAKLAASTSYKAKAFVEHKNSNNNKLPKIYYSATINFTSSANRNWVVSGASSLNAAKAMVPNGRVGDTITYSWRWFRGYLSGNGSSAGYRTTTKTETIV